MLLSDTIWMFWFQAVGCTFEDIPSHTSLHSCVGSTKGTILSEVVMHDADSHNNQTHVNSAPARGHKHAYTYTHKRARTHTYIYRHTHAHIYTHRHSYVECEWNVNERNHTGCQCKAFQCLKRMKIIKKVVTRNDVFVKCKRNVNENNLTRSWYKIICLECEKKLLSIQRISTWTLNINYFNNMSQKA